MKNFSIDYHGEHINVEENGEYRLIFPDERWLSIRQEEDYSKTIASSDPDVRQNTPSSWVVVSTSGGPDWVNREQVQVIGELILRKSSEQEKNKESKPETLFAS